MISFVQNQILTRLQTGPQSSSQLASEVGYPRPSVRRDIQALRKAGYTINDARDNNGLYRLVVA